MNKIASTRKPTAQRSSFGKSFGKYFGALSTLQNHLKACPKCQTTIARDLTFDWLCPEGRALADGVVRVSLPTPEEHRAETREALKSPEVRDALRSLAAEACRRLNVTPASLRGKTERPGVRKAIAAITTMGLTRRQARRLLEKEAGNALAALRASKRRDPQRAPRPNPPSPEEQTTVSR